MVDFRTFMSVSLTECGNDERTFRDLVDLWNREESTIRDLDEEQLREQLTCP